MTARPKTFDELYSWYIDYARTYMTGDSEFDYYIKLKKDHSVRVLRFAESILADVEVEAGLSESTRIAALLHDISRFEQLKRYNTFQDAVSVDHGDLGEEILYKSAILENFSDRDSIIEAVLSHNKRFLPENISEKGMFITQLIRDADKLDIFEIMLNHYKGGGKKADTKVYLSLADTDDDIADEIYNGVISKTIPDKKYMKSLIDFQALQLSWVYDFNFTASLRIVQRNRYIEDLCSLMRKTRRSSELCSIILQHLGEKLTMGR